MDWTGLVKHGLVKHGLVKHGLVKHGLVKHGLVKHGLVKHRLVKHRLVKRQQAAKVLLTTHTIQPDSTVRAKALLWEFTTLATY